MHLEGYADGAFELYSYYSGNSYTVGTNDPVELQSAVIDRRSDDYYTIYLAPQAGLTDLEQIRQAEGVVTIKAAPQALDGLLVSFANEKDAGRILSIAYAGKPTTTRVTTPRVPSTEPPQSKRSRWPSMKRPTK